MQYRRYISSALLLLAWTLSFQHRALADGSNPTIDRASAIAAMQRAVAFFSENVARHGGYVYRCSSDLKLREGEVSVSELTAWLQPPATPSVGQAYLDAYQLCAEPWLLEAAKKTAAALQQGQLVSGGWDDRIEFDPSLRLRHAYRVDVHSHENVGKRRNQTTLDDDKTQSAIRFLMRLDHALSGRDPQLAETVRYALDRLLDHQYPCGAWPQRLTSEPMDRDEYPVVQASFPESWPREFPAAKYEKFYTLNDGTICDVISLMFEAYDTYEDPRYFESAKLGGEFLLLAQMPAPQPGWAQQYDAKMQPTWARKFEPPAITGSESQQVMRTLIAVYRRTGDPRFIEAVHRAIPYYKSCLRPDGKLARFYELRTNRPLYFTKDYRLTDRDDSMPSHYGFVVSSKLDAIERELAQATTLSTAPRMKPYYVKTPTPSRSLVAQAEKAIKGLNAQGAWIESGTMQRDGKTIETEIIHSKSFIENLRALSLYIASTKP